jgi:hypothetical protein
MIFPSSLPPAKPDAEASRNKTPARRAVDTVLIGVIKNNLRWKREK